MGTGFRWPSVPAWGPGWVDGQPVQFPGGLAPWGKSRAFGPRPLSWAAGPAGGGHPGWGWGGFTPPGPAPSSQGEGGLMLLQEGLE